MMIVFGNLCNDNNDVESNFSNLLIRLNNNDPSITGLDIRGEHLKAEQFVKLFQALKNNNTVEHLILRGEHRGLQEGHNDCDLTNKAIYVALSSLLKSNKKIKSLDLYFTGLVNEAMEGIAYALEKNQTLTHLKIQGHNLDLSGELSVIKLLENNASLNNFILNNMSEAAHLVLMSRLEYLTPKNLKISNSTYLTFCGGSYRFKDKENPIAAAIKNKKLKFDEIIYRLETLDFSQKFIENTKDFFNAHFFKPETNILNEYSSLKIKMVEKTKESKDREERIELTKQYEQAKKELLKKHYDFEEANYNLLIQINENFSLLSKGFLQSKEQLETTSIEIEENIDKDVELSLVTKIIAHPAEYISVNAENIDEKENIGEHIFEIKNDNVETISELKEATEDNLLHIEPGYFETLNEPIELKNKMIESMAGLPVPKKIDINNEPKGDKYISEWVEKVTENEYDTVIFSVGGHNQLQQQIPPFAEGLGRVAILNIDPILTVEEKNNVSNSDNISVNYLQEKIKGGDRFAPWVPSSYKQKYLEENINNIGQVELAKNIINLIHADKKVILISHTSIDAPRRLFEEIFKNADIMENYGNKFLYIHSYFNDAPTILCSKEFVKDMMQPKFSDTTLEEIIKLNKEVYKFEDYELTEGDKLKDEVMAYKISTMYQDINSVYAEAKEPVHLLEDSLVFRNLSNVTSEDIMPLLGINDSSDFGDNNLN